MRDTDIFREKRLRPIDSERETRRYRDSEEKER